VSLRKALVVEGKEGRRPATVSSRRPVTTEGHFENGNAKTRVAAQKFSSGPQSAETATDDGDVNVEVSVQGISRTRRWIER
jgi:hypothetical protein